MFNVRSISAVVCRPIAVWQRCGHQQPLVQRQPSLCVCRVRETFPPNRFSHSCTLAPTVTRTHTAHTAHSVRTHTDARGHVHSGTHIAVCIFQALESNRINATLFSSERRSEAHSVCRHNFHRTHDVYYDDCTHGVWRRR